MGDGGNVFFFFVFVSQHHIFKFVSPLSSFLPHCYSSASFQKKRWKNIGCLKSGFWLATHNLFWKRKETDSGYNIVADIPTPTPKRRKSIKTDNKLRRRALSFFAFLLHGVRHSGTATALSDGFVGIWIMHFSFTFALIPQYVRGIKRWWDVQTQRLEIRWFQKDCMKMRAHLLFLSGYFLLLTLIQSVWRWRWFQI